MHYHESNNDVIEKRLREYSKPAPNGIRIFLQKEKNYLSGSELYHSREGGSKTYDKRRVVCREDLLTCRTVHFG